MRRRVIAFCAALLGACGPSAEPAVALPTVQLAEPNPGPEPNPDSEAPAESVRLDLEAGRSGVALRMDAPLELIRGVVRGGVSGYLEVTPRQLANTRGRIQVDLDKLVLERRGPRSAAPERNETQNQHMRQWLEISADAPASARERNRLAEFEIQRLRDPRPESLLSGEEYVQVNAWAVGALSVHGRKRDKQLRVSALFKLVDGAPVAVRAVTLEPLPVGLTEHDVVPRVGFGVLHPKTLDDLRDKVAPTAMIHVNFTAFAPDTDQGLSLPESGERPR